MSHTTHITCPLCKAAGASHLSVFAGSAATPCSSAASASASSCARGPGATPCSASRGRPAPPRAAAAPAAGAGPASGDAPRARRARPNTSPSPGPGSADGCRAARPAAGGAAGRSGASRLRQAAAHTWAPGGPLGPCTAPGQGPGAEAAHLVRRKDAERGGSSVAGAARGPRLVLAADRRRRAGAGLGCRRGAAERARGAAVPIGDRRPCGRGGRRPPRRAAAAGCEACGRRGKRERGRWQRRRQRQHGHCRIGRACTADYFVSKR